MIDFLFTDGNSCFVIAEAGGDICGFNIDTDYEVLQRELNSRRENFVYQDFLLYRVAIESVKSRVELDDCEGFNAYVTVSAAVDLIEHEKDLESAPGFLEYRFCVQLTGDGEYQSQNGAWITTSGDDFDFTRDENIIYDALGTYCSDFDSLVKAAENCFSERFTFEDVHDSALGHFQLRIDSKVGGADLVLINPLRCHEYGDSFKFVKSFYSREEAEEFIDEFETWTEFEDYCADRLKL